MIDFSIYKRLMLDSGAFSVWNSGQEINLDSYIKYCLQHCDKFDYIVNLDCLPGKPGIIPTSRQIKRSARKGWNNYQKMLKAGIPKEKLIHVFHESEDFKWLEKSIKSIPYIGLSPDNSHTTDEKIEWLQECMSYATDNKGYPLAKYHGFAVTSFRMIKNFPWYSVDSATWRFIAGYGGIIVPVKKNGEFNYNKKPRQIVITKRTVSNSLIREHIDKMSDKLKKPVLEYIKMKGYVIGESVEKKVNKNHKLKKGEIWIDKEKGIIEVIKVPGLSNVGNYRYALNSTYFMDLEKHLPKWPSRYRCRIEGRMKFF